MGNANSGPKREKPFLQALEMELKAGGKDHKALRAIARQLIDKATAGDTASIIEVANRTDGKPTVQVDATLDGSVTIQVLRLADHPTPSK